MKYLAVSPLCQGRKKQKTGFIQKVANKQKNRFFSARLGARRELKPMTSSCARLQRGIHYWRFPACFLCLFFSFYSKGRKQCIKHGFIPDPRLFFTALPVAGAAVALCGSPGVPKAGAQGPQEAQWTHGDSPTPAYAGWPSWCRPYRPAAPSRRLKPTDGG